MRIQIKPLVALLCLSGLVATQSFAETSAGSTIDNAQIKNALSKLRKELTQLKSQLREANNKTTLNADPNIRYVRLASNAKTENIIPADASNEQSSEKEQHAKIPHKPKPMKRLCAPPPPPQPQPLTGRDIFRMIAEQRDFLPFDLDVPGQAFVSTGPYVGVPIQYAGAHLIVNTPSVNTDVQLLNIRKKIHRQLEAMGGTLSPEPYHSHLLLSGLVEGQAGYTRPTSGASKTDIDLTTVSFDAFFIGPSDWTLGFIEFSYDGDTPVDSVYTSNNNYRVSNSRIFVNKAFVTLGNLDCLPIYGTFGQFFVPFGTYSSVMVSPPFTQTLGRTKARSILVGLQPPGEQTIYGAVYAFTGDSHPGSISKINNGGVNVGVKLVKGIFNLNVGGGYIANLADSGGMQLKNGFTSHERIIHRVAGYDFRFLLGIGENINLIGEYIGAGTSYNPHDMSFNNRGAQPSAVDAEVAYSFSLFDRPNSVGLGYTKSNEALALDIPKKRYSFVFNTSIWRNTLQSLELRRELNYPRGNKATKAGDVVVAPQFGRFGNAVTAQFDYYF